MRKLPGAGYAHASCIFRPLHTKETHCAVCGSNPSTQQARGGNPSGSKSGGGSSSSSNCAAMGARRPAMRSRNARAAVFGGLLLLLLYTLSGERRSQPDLQQQRHATGRGLTEQAEPEQGGPSGISLPRDMPGGRAKYSLPEAQRVQAIMSGSQQHGMVAKAGPLPPDFWNSERRSWREDQFMQMVWRGRCVCVGGGRGQLAEAQQSACWHEGCL